MIRNVDILSWLQRVLRKETRGNVLSPADFNTFLSMNQRLHFDEQLRNMELTETITTSMSVYVKTKELAMTKVPVHDPLYGVYELSHLGFGHEKPLRCMAMYEGKYERKVDMVTHGEMQERMSNSLTRPTKKHPVGYIEGGKLIVYPYVASVRYTYVSTPDKAYLDYVVHANRTVRYLNEGATVTVGADETWPNQTHNSVSRTKEMEWNDEDKVAVAHRILRAVAPAIQDAGAYQLASEETQKSERL